MMTEEQENTYEALHAIGWELVPDENCIHIVLFFPKGRGEILKDGTAVLDYETGTENLDLQALNNYGG